MKHIIFVIIFCLFIFPIQAGQHRSVPLDHRVYDVIHSAEVRGLITNQISVKPYSTSTVLKLLREIKSEPEKLSNAELKEIRILIDELTYTYETENIPHMLKQGSYRSYSEELGMGIALGAAFESMLTLPLQNTDYHDVRNAARVILRGDILDFASIFMDFGVRYDILDNRAFLDTEFTIPGEGFYFNPLLGASTLKEIPGPHKHVYNVSVDYFPEISLSFMSGSIQFRYGHINRDWGVGHTNLQLAGTARAFDGIEGHIEFSDWLRYSFISGSLGIFSLEKLDGEVFFSDPITKRSTYRFRTNFSAKRAEVDLPGNFTFGIFESCVWQKRFEIGYLNPFGILMFQQNQQGDVDNMLAGIDLQWRVPGLLRLHGTWATTEMNDPSFSRFIKEPRNVMGVQTGVDMALPVGVFSNLSVQYTHLRPFFYSHYPHEDEFLDPIYRGGGNILETAYVNKGENLGYPLHPNSDELQIRSYFGFGSGWDGTITMKYQRRSGQYGYRIDEPMDYSDQDKYEDIDFLSYIFERTFSCEIGLSKKFQDFPLKLFGSYRFSRVIDRDRVSDDSDINHTYADEWNDPEYSHVIQIGFDLFN